MDVWQQDGFALAAPVGARVHISCLNWSVFGVGDADIHEVTRVAAWHQVSELV